MFAKGKPAGLFFPHEDGKVRLPKADETWHVVEGPKDAAALHGLGLLACGLNTCRLAAKFGRLFKDVNVILIPDRDRAGEEGAEHSAGVLRNVALSTQIAALPAEFKESNGDDVRDVLRRPGGRELVLQAIADAKPSEAGGESGEGEDSDVSAEIPVPEGDPLTLTVSPTFGKPQRRVVVKRGEISHRDRINTDSDISRGRFIKKLAGKLEVEVDVLGPLVDPQLTTLADQTDEQASATGGPGDEEKGQATLVADMAAEWEVWHTPSKDAFATIPVGDHDENWPIRSQTFKRFISKQFYEEQQKALGNDALSAAINLIEANALFSGQQHEAHVRVAEHEGSIYIDLGNDAWEVVEVTSKGWRVVDESPVKFRRSRSMLPLPNPKRGGRVDELRGFLNVDDSTWTLVVAWLVTALRPNVRFPVLALFAEQGSGKSTTGRLLRELVDPNAAPLRAEPRDARDLMIAANNSWCLAFDNLSYVPSWLSDALCRLSTGGGFATRELYTDQDEVIFDAMRPILLTSIEEVATRSDLLDRCVIVWLPAIPEDQRRPEAELIEAFRKARPRIFGALLDAVAGALRDLSTTEVSGLPRMADFALWATAAESALGWSKGTFMAAYNGNRESANDLALESSTIARPLLDLLEDRGEWCGSASELLEVLEPRVTDQIKRQKSWPKNGRSIAGHLKRLSPNLRAAGWEVEYQRQASQRLWSIRRLTDPASSDPFASQPAPVSESVKCENEVQSDANRCDLPFHDADDANDADPETPTAASADNGRDWEEGDL